jgi:mono/diheme cytochrome c family protein
MRTSRLWIVAVLLVLIFVVAITIASCGGTTATTAVPSTTAAPTTTTAAPTTTTAAPTTTTAAPTTTTAAPTTTTAAPTTTTAAIDAKALYAQYCQGCHKRVPSASVAVVTKAIANGRESMPGFADKMTPEQIAALAAWVNAGGK